MADLQSKTLDPPPGPNSFNFMQFLGKWQNRMLEPPEGLVPPTSGKSWIMVILVLETFILQNETLEL